MVTSGVRLGTPAGTTRGFGVAEFQKVGDFIARVLDAVAARHITAKPCPKKKRQCAPKLKRCVREKHRFIRGFACAAFVSAGNADTQVKDSRPTEENTVIRRRRVCADCGGRFTTFERIQLRELTIIKNTGRKVPFDRDKLMRSVQVALRKRPVEPERIERMVSGIVRRLENLGESEIHAKMVGELVMEGLYALDQVAYVRFASVYRNFREAKDFEEFLGEMSGQPDP